MPLQAQVISPQDVINVLVEPSPLVKAIDVRSPGEFCEGAIARFENLPILTDEERQLVGLCYKKEGQKAAIALGHNLVAPHREDRIARWMAHLKNADLALVACWRGGLRSEIAAQWLTEAGMKVWRVEHGYKGLRAELLKMFAEIPATLVLAGATGSGKTKLLREVAVSKIDLEEMAVHRGSAFGDYIQHSQPSQASFENTLGLALRGLRRHPTGTPILIEDESFFVGRVHLPATLHQALSFSPVVKITAPMADRLALLYEEYVKDPVEFGVDATTLGAHYEKAVIKIRNRLGGAMASAITAEIKEAFAREDIELHQRWIRSLLIHYYDKMYEYSFARNPRKVVFQGDWSQCRAWIQNQFA